MNPDVTYSRAAFDVADADAARRIILTPEFGLDTDTRWACETPYLADLIATHLEPKPESLVIDYGCGIGRLAKVLIERFGCRVLGVDISERMRALAVEYVGSQAFSAVSPHVFHSLAVSGLRADHAIAIWVLQHVLKPEMDTKLIARALKPGAGLFVVNLQARAVPTNEGIWANDGIDVRELLAAHFDVGQTGHLDPAVVTAFSSAITFWATYARR